MKINQYILSFVTLFLISCGAHNSLPAIENYSFIRKESFDEYYLISYTNSKDSILVVLDRETTNKCKNLTFNQKELSNLKRIPKLNENFGFYYNDSILSNRKGFKITSGAFEPGESGKKRVYSYNGMPYLIDNCN